MTDSTKNPPSTNGNRNDPDLTFAGPWGYENWKGVIAGLEEGVAHEFQLYSDAGFFGDIVDPSSPYQVLNLNAARHPSGDIRCALVLRSSIHRDYYTASEMKFIRENPRPRDVPKGETKNYLGRPYTPSKTDHAQFHGGDVPDEIAALLSLALGVRLYAGEQTRAFFRNQDPRGRPVGYSARRAPTFVRGQGDAIVPNVLGSRTLSTALIADYPSLAADDAIALLRAARSYQEAIWVAESNPSLAWVLLVSSVETAATRWSGSSQTDPMATLKALKPDFVARLHEAGGDGAVGVVAVELVHQLKAGYKFREFLAAFMPGPPSPRPPEKLGLPWTDPEAMKKLFSSIYALRSLALHDAVPFPPLICDPPASSDPDPMGVTPLAEIPVREGVRRQGGFWTPDSTPMMLNTFEYVVRCALQAWWRQGCPGRVSTPA